MQPLKKYFTDGLIQVAIVLSLAGMNVDPYYPPPHTINIESPRLTQSSNSPRAHDPHIKSLDVESSVLVPRYFHWIHSLRHLRIPTAHLEAWLVHSEPDNSGINIPNLTGAWDDSNELVDMEDSSSLNMRIGGGASEELGNNLDIDGASLGVVTTPLRSHLDFEDINEHANEFSPQQQEIALDIHSEQVLQEQYLGLLNDDYEDELRMNNWQHANPFSNPVTSFREDLQFTGLDEDNSLATEECLQILEAGVPLEHMQNLADPNPLRDEDSYLQYHGSLYSPLSHQEPVLDLEQQWQDVLAVMEPQDIDDVLDGSHFTYQERTRTLENSIQQNLSPDQPTFSRSSQNFIFNDPGIMDFLLLPTPDSLNMSMPMEDLRQSSLFIKEPMLNETDQLSQTVENISGNQTDSDSGLSLDYSQSLASPCQSESSFCSSSSNSSLSSSHFIPEDGAVGYTIKEEPMNEEGAVGGYTSIENKMSYINYQNYLQFQYSPWFEYIDHDHTYNQPPHTNQRKFSKKYAEESLEYNLQDNLFTRDENRARDMRIPFSTDYIINLPVEEFNELLAKHCLSEAQLALIRDIRRRGKNKVAAQNCRRRKLDILQDLERSVDGLRRHRARLLREKSDILCSVKEMKQRLNDLYQDVRNRLGEMERISCLAMDFTLQAGKNDRVSSSRRRAGKKQKDRE